jgi:hypothetical protein
MAASFARTCSGVGCRIALIECTPANGQQSCHARPAARKRPALSSGGKLGIYHQLATPPLGHGANATLDQRLRPGVLHSGMEAFASVQCPHCGGPSEIGIDTTIAEQEFTTDCEVCCRPFEVRVACEPGEIVSLGAQMG